MGMIIVKSMQLRGRIASPADKYYDASPGPAHYDTAESFTTLERFLMVRGKPIVPLKMQPLPFIKDGCITSSAAYSCYIFNKCLIANNFRPHFHGNNHVVQAAARLEEEIEEAFGIIRDNSLWYCRQYWGAYDEKKIVEVPESSKDMAQLIQYIPKLFNYHEGMK